MLPTATVTKQVKMGPHTQSTICKSHVAGVNAKSDNKTDTWSKNRPFAKIKIDDTNLTGLLNANQD